jgi:hypothetical protein
MKLDKCSRFGLLSNSQLHTNYSLSQREGLKRTQTRFRKGFECSGHQQQLQGLWGWVYERTLMSPRGGWIGLFKTKLKLVVSIVVALLLPRCGTTALQHYRTENAALLCLQTSSKYNSKTAQGKLDRVNYWASWGSVEPIPPLES